MEFELDPSTWGPCAGHFYGSVEVIFIIPNKKVGIFQGGVVGRKDGSQDMVKNYVFGEG